MFQGRRQLADTLDKSHGLISGYDHKYRKKNRIYDFVVNY
jgi:hypothetical protein